MTDKKDHINYALVARTHTPMYMMHKYFARKPHNVVAEYIKKYSKKGDVVLDPFVGSGVTLLEAVKHERKSIGIDLDPMAIFITRTTAKPVDLSRFDKEYGIIEANIRSVINDLYETKCTKCGRLCTATHTIWAFDEKAKEEKQETIWYTCDNCRPRGTNYSVKNPDTDDLKLYKSLQKKQITLWYPKNELIWNSRINVWKDEKVSDLFSKRNLYALTLLYNEITKIKDIGIKELMLLTFTSCIAQASKLIPVVHEGKECKSWTVRGYWIPPKHFEINAWNCFYERYIKVRRGKEESNSLIRDYKEAKSTADLKKGANAILKNASVLELDKIIKPNSIDYVFTDPPYGDDVPYLELDYMWSSWLKFKPNFDDEIIISDSPVRNKTDDIYETMLRAAFRQIYNVLKPGRWMTVTFHNTNIKVWNSILSSCINAGFDLEKIIYQPPPRASAKSYLHPYASAVGDYYLRFRKPVKSSTETGQEIDEERYKRTVLEAAIKIIAERGEPTPYTYILNGIMVELKKEGALLTGKTNPDVVMKEFEGKEFVLLPVKDEKGKVVGHKWWFKDPAKVPYLEIVPLADRVETSIVDVLRRKAKISFDDILQEVFIKFPNALTPDTQSIKDILSEYAQKTADGKWILKTSVKSRESQHSQMIYELAILGKKAGFQIWIGQNEQGKAVGDKKLFEYCTVPNPTFNFVKDQDRAKQVDVLWHKKGTIYYEFEVEHTTAITEAVVRGSNILNETAKRFIVIPEERQKFLLNKIEDPILKENILKAAWRFTFYKDVSNLFIKHKRTKKLELKEVDSLSKKLEKEPFKQLSFESFDEQ